MAHWAHGPRWVTFDSHDGDDWYGFERVRQPIGLPSEILLIPLGGHSPGNTVVAAQGDDGWLVHAGDAYYYHGEIQPDPAPAPPFLDSLQGALETGRALRLRNLYRLRSLALDRTANVQIVSAHDPCELRRYS